MSKGGAIVRKRDPTSNISSGFSGQKLRLNRIWTIGIYLPLLPIGVPLCLICCRDQVQTTLKAKDKRGNEKLLFHGSNRACLLGESSASVLLCDLKECYLCSILRSSFDVSKCGMSIYSLPFARSHPPIRFEEFVQAVCEVTFGESLF